MTNDNEIDNFFKKKTSSYSNIINSNETSELNKNKIIDCIKTVQDPEIPVNLYDLGLIYSIKIERNSVYIEMTLTNPNCPVAGIMPEKVGKSIEHLKGLISVDVKLVWEPKWSKGLMSEDAKLALDIF